jgi:hypothetical protein
MSHVRFKFDLIFYKQTNATTTPLNIILRNVIQKAKPQRLSPKAQLPNQRWEARKEALLSF